MADYQLLGDTFGYHPGYPPNPSQQNAALAASQPGAGQAGLGMLPGSVPGPGQQPYHPLQTPRPGYPQADPLMSHKLHSTYPGYPSSAPPGSSAAIRSQYSQNYMPHAAMDSYAGLSMGQPHLAAAGQSLAPAYGQHQNLMGQYAGQRMHAPSPLHPAPRHPSMPSQYASTYGSSSQTASTYHSGSSGELWSSGQNMSHLQQSPFSSFSQAAAAGSASSAASANSLHTNRSSQFSAATDYGSSSSNPYFSNHLTADSSYPPGYPAVSSTQSQATSSRSSSSSVSSRNQQQQQQQQQYSSQLGPYSTTPSAASISAQTNQQAAAAVNSASSNNSTSRFSHYSYPQSMPFDPASQARLSPFPTPAASSGSQTPNSPQYRTTSGYPASGSASASQLPVLSPRRPTATPPAGSPMPPTSHTPGPPSVGSNSTQSSTQGSAFSIATPSGGGGAHHLPGSASSGTPSSLQQLEQMVMPHLNASSSNSSATTSKSLATSSVSSSSTFFPTNVNSSPISPQSQSQQSKLFPIFPSSSSSTQSSQYPYHQYSQPPIGSHVQWQPPGGPMSNSPAQHNTHPHKPSAMIGTSLHGAQHLSPSTNASSKSLSANDSSSQLHQPYSYGSSSKTSNESESAEYSQPFSSSNSHSSSSSTSSIPVSHSLSQSGYNNLSSASMSGNSGLTSYEALSNQKQQQSAHKNDTQLFDPKNNRSVLEPLSGDLNPMAGQQSQMTSLNSNSYHSMMQQQQQPPQTQSYSSPSLSSYSGQSRFDPMSSQYGMSSEISNSNSTYDHDSSMMYDPYNIDNSLGIPPHQTMSEYRESQANLQQSNSDFVQNDPYAANFDDFDTGSKRKSKGRPKKDSTAPKKERKPRAPRTPSSTRGTGRGRGRGAKNVPIPSMIPEFGNDPSSQFGGVPPMSHPVNDSLDMYNSRVDMFSAPMQAGNKILSPNQMSLDSGMMANSQSTLNSSVLSQPPSVQPPPPPPPPPADMIPSYGPPPPQPPPLSSLSQGSSQLLHNSLPQPMPPAPPPPSTGPTFEPMAQSMAESGYQNFSAPDNLRPISGPPPTVLAEPTAPLPNSSVCDKELSNENDAISEPTYDDRFLPDSLTSSNNGTPNHVSLKVESSLVPNAISGTVAPVSDDIEMGDLEKSQMSFTSSMDITDSSIGPIPAPPPPPITPPPASSPAQPLPPPLACTPILAPEATTGYSPADFITGKPIFDRTIETIDNNDLLDKSSNGFDSSSLSVVPNQPPHMQTQIATPSMGGMPDFNSTFSNYTDEQPSGFISSTPIVEVKPKKAKKRKTKKDEQATIVDDSSAINESSPIEVKPKKKRTKKPKAVVEPSISLDNLALSLDLDEKTQLSSNLDSSAIPSELDTPKPKPKPKKKKRPTKAAAAPVELSETNIPEEGADLNGDLNASVEIPEEKPKRPKLKNKSPKKKMPKLALKLKQNKKRRRGFGSPDNSDLEKTPPPSPLPDDESAIHKRRSARNTKRQRYNDDLDLDLSDDEFGNKNNESQVVNVQLTEDTMVVEKILSSRIAKRELELEPHERKEGDNPNEPVFVDVEEFYVKYKNLSYLHCDWKTEDELEKGDRRISQKLKRYKQKKDVNVFDFLDDEPFNPDYVEVDRVLDVNEIEEIIEEEEEEEVTASETKPFDVGFKPVEVDSTASEIDPKPSETDLKPTDNDVKPSNTDIDPEISNVDQKPAEAEFKLTEADPKLAEDGQKLTEDDQKLTEAEPKLDETEPKLVESESKLAESDPKFAEVHLKLAEADTKIVEVDPQTCVVDPKLEVPKSSDCVEAEEKLKTNGESTNGDCAMNEKFEVEEKKLEKVGSPEEKEFKTEDQKNEGDENNDDKPPISNEKESSQTEVENRPDTVDANVAEQKLGLPEKKKKTTIRKVRHFLVKWRGLSYEESTWELEDDIDPAKIQQFWKFRNPPPRSEWKIKKRPKANEWKKLEQSHTYKNGNSLREYQLEGVNWLSFCWHNGQNCILADEMGLGKTIQSITFVQEMVTYGIPYPYLVIVPLSTIGNWQREFETWTDLNVVTYHGSSPSRNMLQEYELYYKNDKNERIPNVYKFQVMITTFEVILSDCLELSRIKWVACIIDEAHRLKNRNCKLLEGLRMLNIEHRVLLSGTPLQNNVEELFSLLHFLEPSQFTSNDNFLLEFGDLKTEAQVDKLKAILKPMMLRRLKEDVEKSLAPKEETIIEVELTNVQKKYYRAILERNFQFLSKGGTYANMPNLMNTVMELRKCCIHPFLINGAEEQILQEFRQQHSDELTLNAIIQSSGKLVLIDKLLPRLKENGHRVLIFSQMVRCLDILEDYLCQRRYPYERIDGRVRGNLRQAAIDRYSKPDSDRFAFLLCTRAGGLGINLTAADTVIIFDSDWNPQNDLQAQARCHRIGQTKAVKVYRLICRNTYEREMFDRASLKLGLDKAVLQSINAQKAASVDGQMSKKEIEDLLRKGAYGALMDDDNAGDKFCEEDIDMILQRRTTKIIIESEGKGGSFSKASFATSDNRTDIEIDDPNFWEKWAKKANFDIDELKGRNELIVEEPRRRTQTKRFGADDAVLDITDLDTSTDEEEAISMRTRGSRNRPLKKRKKGRNYDPEHDEDYAQEVGFGWSRSEFFRVEKGLLTFGWDRWDDCLKLANFKRNLTQQDVEDISRIILLFSLQNYKGDEKVKAFVLDLITPPGERNNSVTMEPELDINKSVDFESNMDLSDDGKCCIHGRRNKKNKMPAKLVCEELETLSWAKSEKYNPEVHLSEDFRKHLLRHANKLLLRIRMLAYIKTDIIGDLHDKVFSYSHVRDIPIPYCQPDNEPPNNWWDEEADKSLLVGIYKHGYDRYNLIRHDQSLCFFSRCGPPDGAALLAELSSKCDDNETLEEDEPETPATPATPQLSLEANREDQPAKAVDVEEAVDKDGQSVAKEEKSTEQLYLPFPSAPELNNRLRRLVTSYQRNFKKEEARIAQKARHQQRIERIEKFEAVMRAKEMKKREQAQKKWSRREESDFYRVISSFGIEYDSKTDTFDWGKFRTYAKLERKLDETLTEYFKAFYAMCKKVVGRTVTEDEENLPISVDPITEEKANRCLARIDLLSKVREEILQPDLEERLKICQPQLDLPDWWVCGKHDKDLLLGAAKYGLSRLDYNLMNEPDLSFIEIVRAYDQQMIAFEDKKENIEIEVGLVLGSLVDTVVELVPFPIVNESDEKPCNESQQNVQEAKVSDDLKKEEAESDYDNKDVSLALSVASSIDDKDKSPVNTAQEKDMIKKEPLEESEETKLSECSTETKDSQVQPLSTGTFFGATGATVLSTQPKPQLKWPRDRVLQIRLENVCLALEKNEWPTFRGLNSIGMAHSTTPSVATADSGSPRPSTPCSMSSASQEPTPLPTPDHTPRHESQSPFTGEYYFPNTAAAAAAMNSNMMNFEADRCRTAAPVQVRRRRRKRFEMENDRNNKLHSLLNAPFEQPTLVPPPPPPPKQQINVNIGSSSNKNNTNNSNINNININSNNNNIINNNNNASGSSSNNSKNIHNNNVSANSKLQAPLTNNALSALTSTLLKNSKGPPNSFLNNLPPHLLTPLLNSLPLNIRNLFRDSDLFNDEKTSQLLNNNIAAAAAAANSTSSPSSSSSKSKSASHDSKGSNLQSGPPPAHQSSSSRNALPLGTLDLTAKFKNAASTALEKAATLPSTRSTNHPYPAHKQMNKNMAPEKADVLDLSSVTSHTSKHDSKVAISMLSQSLQKSIDLKNSPFFTNPKNFAGLSSHNSSKQQSSSSSKKQLGKGGRIGIDALALNLQAKKMMEEVKQVDTATTLVNKVQHPKAMKTFNEKELLAALTNLGEKRPSANSLFDEFAKQSLSHSMKNKNNPSTRVSTSATSITPVMKKPVETKASNPLNFFESLKILSQKPTKESTSQLQKNMKTLLEEHPELLGPNSSLSSLLSSPLMSQFSGLAPHSTAPSTSTASTDEKSKPSRSKRTRSQFESPNTSTSEEPLSKRAAMLNVNSKTPSYLDPKNPNFKYLSNLLDKSDGIEAKIKNFINLDKSASFKTPVSLPSNTGSSIRTRTSDKRSSTSSTSSSSSTPTSAASFANLNASSLLNNLSLAAAAAGSGSGSNKQQTAAASLLNYANALNSVNSKSNTSNFSNSASQFSNFGFNPSIFPSVKMFLDAAAAAAAAAAVSKSSSAPSNTSSVSSNSHSTSTTPSTNTTPSLSSFANLLGMNSMTNPLLNFSNFANLSALGAKKQDSAGGVTTNTTSSGVDLASLFANNLASATATFGGDDKSKNSKTMTSSSSTSTSSGSSKGKTGLNPSASAAAAAAASMLGSSSLGSSALPFLYSNPNFSMSGLNALYNPLSLGNFGLSSPFLNNPNLMNGLANFSNVFTSTTPTLSSNSNQPLKTRSSSSNKPATTSTITKPTPRKTTNSTTASSASGLSLASGLLASSAAHTSTTPTTSTTTTGLDSDEESLKSLMGHDDDDDLNGEFGPDQIEESKSRKAKPSRKQSTSSHREGKSKRSSTSK